MTHSPAPIIRAFFDQPTNTISYLVADPVTRRAAVIDPVLDFDQRDGTVDVRSVEAILAAAKEAKLTIEWVLETHAHADHLSGAPYIKSKTGARIGIGEHIKDVQRIFRPVFNAEDLRTDGSDFDRLFADGETFGIGELVVEVLHTPGHTPADLSLQDRRRRVRRRHAVHAGLRHCARRFSGRRRTPALSFDPAAACSCPTRRGCSCATTTRRLVATTTPGKPRCASSARTTSIFATASPKRRSWPCGRRATRHCPAPTLLLPSIQVNIRAGRFPKAESNGVHYLLLPVRARAGAEAAIVS